MRVLNQYSQRYIASIGIKIFIGFLIISGLFLRMAWIKTIPFAYYHDEMDYVINGEAIARYGTDLSGNWQPRQLKPIRTYNITAELTPVFQALVQKMFGPGVENGHLTSMIFGLLTIPVAAILIYLFVQDKKTALIYSLLLLVNPWHIHISRMAYEAPISLFFQILFLLGFLISYRFKTRQQLSLVGTGLALAGMFFAFFTYHGAKVTIAGLLMIISFIALKIPKNHSLKITLFLSWILFIVLGGYFYYGLQHSWYGGRESDFIFSEKFLSQNVNEMRRLSLTYPMQNLVLNKATILFSEAIKRFANVFNINQFFIGGMESGFQFSLFVHGFWYLSSIALFFYGLTEFWHKWRKHAQIWLLFIIVAPLASVISTSYQTLFRSALVYVLLLLPVSVGITKLYKKVSDNFVYSLLISVLLMLEIVWFGAQYFGRYALTTAENSYFEDRLLSRYIALTKTEKLNRPILVIVSDSSYRFARDLVAYTNSINMLSEAQRMQFVNFDLPTYSLPNITVTDVCPTKEQLKNSTILIKQQRYHECSLHKLLTDIYDYEPETAIDTPTISSPVDSGAYFYVINDQICQNTKLPNFVYTNQLKNFALDKLDAQNFCQVWLRSESVL